MSFNKGDFLALVTKGSIEGFDFKIEIQGFSWSRLLEDHTEKIILGYKDYSSSFYLQTPSASILFPQIEHTLSKIGESIGIKLPADGITFQASLGQVGGIDYKVLNSEINSESSFMTVFSEETKIIEKAILPFFKTYGNLTNVADFLAKLRPQEVVPYIQGAKLFAKTILILRETGHPSFENKMVEFHDVLKIQANKKEVYRQQLQLFEKLFME